VWTVSLARLSLHVRPQHQACRNAQQREDEAVIDSPESVSVNFIYPVEGELYGGGRDLGLSSAFAKDDVFQCQAIRQVIL
jgi:hypothetical protein